MGDAAIVAWVERFDRARPAVTDVVEQSEPASENEHELVVQLREALVSRAPIEQAKGILMGLHRCTADDAFRILRRMSNDTNRKLHDVAADLIRDTQRTLHTD